MTVAFVVNKSFFSPFPSQNLIRRGCEQRPKLIWLGGFISIASTILIAVPLDTEARTVAYLQTKSKENDLKSEIDKLIVSLSGLDEYERELAGKMLQQIGPSALDQLRDLQDKETGETKTRITQIIRNISRAHHIPIRVNGVEFSLTVPKVWAIAETGKPTIHMFSLRIKNTSTTVYRFSFRERVKFLFTDQKGNSLMNLAGSEGATKALRVSPPLQLGEVFELPIRGALGRLKVPPEMFNFSCTDPFSVVSIAREVRKGIYELSAVYEITNEKSGEQEPCWVGKAHTIPQTVEIK